MALDKAAILGAKDIATTEVKVPEWGGSVLVRSMTGAEREEFDATMGKDPKGGRLRLVILSCCDESGARLFTDADVGALAGKSAVALDRVCKAAMQANGLIPPGDAEKNS